MLLTTAKPAAVLCVIYEIDRLCRTDGETNKWKNLECSVYCGIPSGARAAYNIVLLITTSDVARNLS